MTLKAGFTTIRDLGGPPFLAVDLRESIDEGFLRRSSDRCERAGVVDDERAR